MLEKIFSIDSAILMYLQENVRCSFLTPILVFISTLGNGGFIFILLGILLLIFKKTRKDGILYSSALLLNFLLTNLILKNLVMRPRPYSLISELTILVSPLKDFSFPSGHTAAAFCAATILLFINKKASIVAFIFAVMTAFSRLYVGVHYPTDVLAGAFVGAFSSLAVWFLYNKCIKNLLCKLRLQKEK